MTKKRIIDIAVAVFFYLAFGIFTYLVKSYDVRAIGPLGSSVGFASINKVFFDSIAPNEMWYELTNLIAYLGYFICFIFACAGAVQLFTRKSLLKVDRDIICLGIIYALAIAAYFVFEKMAVNFRPVLEDGMLAASYPSSHTVFAFTVFASLVIEIRRRVTDSFKALIYEISCDAFICLIIGGRLLSGWHWFTDIAGGVILGIALIFTFLSILPELPKNNNCGQMPGFASDAIKAIKDSEDSR